MAEPELKPAAHRQTLYRPSPRLDPPQVLTVPELTQDRQRAVEDLSVYGMCLLEGALDSHEVDDLRERVGTQASAERALGQLAPAGAKAVQQQLSNLVNKGQPYLDLVVRDEVDVLAGFLLGKDFLISTLPQSVATSRSDSRITPSTQRLWPITAVRCGTRIGPTTNCRKQRRRCSSTASRYG